VIKAVFFDWLNTIAYLKPDRHEIFSQILNQFDIETSPDKLIRGIYAAENQVPMGAPPKWREGEDENPFVRYQEIVLAEIGVTLPRDAILDIVKRINQIAMEAIFVLYDDVLPTFKKLKKQNLILGLITNLYKDSDIILRKLGLDRYLDLVVTSKEVGVDKPASPIFLAALERAGIDASEAVYIGDQYQTDVGGARGVGINPILIDRYDLSPEVSDCPRIHSLTELAQYL